MRALVYTAPRVVDLQERPRPVPGAGEVEIAIEVAGICGSDVSGFLGHSPRRQAPLILGHELVGRRRNGSRIVANPLISCGRCEACLAGSQNLCPSWRLLGMDQTAGSFAEFVKLPESQTYAIPDELASSRAILAEPLANVVHLFRLLAPQPFFRLAIVGAGTMGALTLLTSLRLGARDVLVVDVSEERLASARVLGARYAINTATIEGIANAKAAAGAGFDIVVDASGSSAARQLALDLCRPGGQVLLLGLAQQKSELDFVASIRKEHRILTSFAYTPVDFTRALGMLIAGEVDLSSHTAELPLERGQEAFDTVTGQPGSILKMMLRVS